MSRGKFSTKEQLKEYETFWHERVFMPAWLEVNGKVREMECKC